jgi:AcrR family transcriptional regulator
MDDAQKEKRKEKIFRAAVWCFNKKGYYETTIDAIASRAKVSKGSIYYYFKSKKELFLELFHYRVNKYFDQLKDYIKEEKSPDIRLRMFINKSASFSKRMKIFSGFVWSFSHWVSENQKSEK